MSQRNGITSGHSLRKMRGFTLLETMVVLGLSLVMMAAGTQYVVRHTENMANESASDHMEIMASGAREYARANETAILNTLSSSPTAGVSVAVLKAQGYVPATVAETNNFGQSYSIRFVKNGPTAFEGLVVTQGGEAIKGINKRKIAQSLGAPGGHIDENSMTQLNGSFESWARPLSDFGLGAGQAELAYALFVEEAVDSAAPASEQYMSRKAVAGMPELNQMQADLDMAGHSIVGIESLEANELKATSGTIDTLHLKDVEVTNSARFVGSTVFETNGGQGPVIHRTDGAINANIEYRTTAGSVFAGQGTAGAFVVGSKHDLSNPANRMFEVNSAEAKVNGAVVWTTDTFDPDTKAEAQHLHNASEINAGVLNVARIPNLDASKISTGVLNAARIPALDASKITSGVFQADRIPVLPIGKISGLQAALDVKVSKAGDTMTGPLTFANGADIFKTALGTRLYSGPAGGTLRIIPGSGSHPLALHDDTGVETYTFYNSGPVFNGGPIWHAGNFNPDTKANVSHLHNAADINAGVLNAARIPNLDASKISAGVFDAARIPNLDASKITSGVLHADRIPVLPISKVTGLQGALDGKLSKAGDTMAGPLGLQGHGTNQFISGNGDAATYATQNVKLRLHWGLGLEAYNGVTRGVYDARTGTWDTQGGYKVNGQAVWHTGTFNPDTKQNSLGFTPAQQGGGVGQLGNKVAIGWSGSRVKVTVDATDMGNVVFDSHIQDVVRTSGNQTINGQKIFSDWLRTTGDAGWYSQTYGGGFHMVDTNWIRAYNNKGIHTGGEIRSGSLIHSDGNVTAGGGVIATGDISGRYFRPQQTATCNTACSPNGLIAIATTGAALSCQSGAWMGYSCSTGGGGDGGGGGSGGCYGEMQPPGCQPAYPTGWKCGTTYRQCQ